MASRHTQGKGDGPQSLFGPAPTLLSAWALAKQGPQRVGWVQFCHPVSPGVSWGLGACG